MSRSGAITFKGNAMTLLGNELKVGSMAPEFTVHFFKDGLKTLTLADLKGKPSLVSVVPSLDTGVCQTQTKKLNEELSAMSDKINAVTISRDLPFAMNRFCGAENIANLKVGSDYQAGKFGADWGLTIDELKLLTRALYVLDASAKVVHAEIVPEVTSEPNYAAAIEALKKLI
jgi:thioredoxin-dependent peroxiredoxin